jgi:hypothetical protein
LNPEGSATSYVFEYAPAGGSFRPVEPEGSGSAGEGAGPTTVQVALRGLDANSSYRYRVTTTDAAHEAFQGAEETFVTAAPPSAAEAEACPNAGLRAEQPFGRTLPDCRAYEMVSPVEKNGNPAGEPPLSALSGSPLREIELARAAPSGEAVYYTLPGSFAGGGSSLFLNGYVSRREAGSWSTRPVTPPFVAYVTAATPFNLSLEFTPELTAGVVESDALLAAGVTPGYMQLYRTEFGSNAYRWVSAVPQEYPYHGPYSEEAIYSHELSVEGGSSDLQKVVFSLGGENEYSSGTHGVFEWSGGRVGEVSVDNHGNPMGNAVGGDVWHSVSADASRVLFRSGGQVYLRENVGQPQSAVEGGGETERCIDPAEACTVEVSASERAQLDPNGPQGADLLGASADGSRVFFLSKAELTEDAYTGPADNAANLYEYDVGAPEGHRLRDLTVDSGDEDGASVQGVVQVSEDGAYVYFVASGKLAAGAVVGEPNLYMVHDGGAPVFIATLSLQDRLADWRNAVPVNHTALSPDGTRLAFGSRRDLAGYDNLPAGPKQCTVEEGYEGEEKAGGSVPCGEVYLFDASTGTLVCPSCDASGARPTGPSSLGPVGEGTGNTIGQTVPVYGARHFSADGSRLFFQSFDGLVAQGSNEHQNVYEYENGHAYPLSDVTGDSISWFLDASPSGDDVFIATSDRLVPQDTDTLADVYDVRVDGGFPASSVSPVCGSGDACKPPPAGQPGAAFGPPGSATFSGPGNTISAPVVVSSTTKPKRVVGCGRGRVRRGTKCVRVTRRPRAPKRRMRGRNVKSSKRGRK